MRTTLIETVMMRSYTIGIISQLTYGHKVDSFDDEYFLLGERFTEITGDAVTPSLLDVHPLCEDLCETQFPSNPVSLIVILPRFPSCLLAIVGSRGMVRQIHQRQVCPTTRILSR